MNLLLAEDDAVARMTLAAVLRGLGYEVTEVEHGGEAWDNVQIGHFPIVISDWQMPEIEGPELCRRFRARATDRYTYFLLIAATGGKTRYLEGMEAGADDFITKPVDIDELRARLKAAERMLGLHHHVQQLEGLLPICAYCKRIRDASERWESIERTSRRARRRSSVTAIVRSATRNMCARRSKGAGGADDSRGGTLGE